MSASQRAGRDRTRLARPFDVVVVPFPFADRLAEKRRPALVISTARLSAYDLVWVAMITTAVDDRWSCDVAIVDIEAAGLPAPSIVRTAKIACIEPSRIERLTGHLAKSEARAVQLKLRSFLALS